VLAAENILSVEVVAFEELGMEAVRKIVVKNMPAFILTDDKGNDFFDQYNRH
jgi:fumarate hydratase class I